MAKNDGGGLKIPVQKDIRMAEFGTAVDEENSKENASNSKSNTKAKQPVKRKIGGYEKC